MSNEFPVSVAAPVVLVTANVMLVGIVFNRLKAPNPFIYCVAAPLYVKAILGVVVALVTVANILLPATVVESEVTVPPPAAELIVIVLPTVPKVILVPPTKVIAPTLALNEVTPAPLPPPAPI